jgi:hypothetical protein
MKLKKLLLNLGLSAVLMASSFFLFKCQPEEQLFEESTFVVEQEKRQTKVISFEKLPVQFVKPIHDLEQTIRSNTKTIEDLLIIDHSQIIEVIDSLSNVRFSIRFSLPNQPDNVLYNLVLGSDAQNIEIEPFVLKYVINNPEEVYSQGFFDIAKMQGKISEYRLDTFLVYVDAISDRTVDVEPAPCAEYSNEDNPEDDESSSHHDSNEDSSTGGGGATGNPDNSHDPNSNSTSNDPLGGNGEFENPDDVTCTSILIWSNATTGQVTGISWSCSDGSSGYLDLDRSTQDPECPGNGDVAVNPRDLTIEELPPSCESFEFTKVGGTDWQTAAVSGIYEMFWHVNWDCLASHTSIFREPLYFQLPINGDYPLDSGSTKTISAILLHRAFESFDVWYNLNICDDSSSATAVDQRLFEYIKEEFEDAGGNVTRTPPYGYVGTPVPYEANLSGYGNCN